MSDDYLWNRSGPPDPEVQKLEELLAPLAHDAPLDELRLRRRRPPWLVLGIALAAAAAALAIFFALPRDPAACEGGEGFSFTGVGGDVSCGGARLAKGVLPVGEHLETGANEASLAIADIGVAKLGKQTRVRLDRTDPERHQLTLDRGHMHARVIAPPRLFAVATKHTDVIDLGCEYTIDVDESGAGNICVLSGIVELAARSGAIAVAPEGTCASILTGGHPGLPHAHDARPAIVAAIRAYERGDAGALDTLLEIADRRDAITLIALAALDPRGRTVLERLMELSPPPDAEISVESALEDPAHLALWRDDIIQIFVGLWGPGGSKRSP